MNKKGAIDAYEYVLITILVTLVAIFAVKNSSSLFNNINQNLANEYSNTDKYQTTTKIEDAENIIVYDDEITNTLYGGENYTARKNPLYSELEFNENKTVFIINGKNNDSAEIADGSIRMGSTGELGLSFDGTCSGTKLVKNESGITSSQISFTSCGERMRKNSIIYFDGDDIEEKGNVIYQLNISGKFEREDGDLVDFNDIPW